MIILVNCQYAASRRTVMSHEIIKTKEMENMEFQIIKIDEIYLSNKTKAKYIYAISLILFSVLLVVGCKSLTESKRTNSMMEFAYIDQFSNASEYLKSNTTSSAIQKNDSTKYFIPPKSLNELHIVLLKTITKVDTFNYILTQNGNNIFETTLLTTFKSIHDLYKFEIRKTTFDHYILLSLIGILKNDDFALVTYRINQNGMINIENKKIDFKEIMPELPFTNPIDSIFSITEDSIKITYEERFGVSKNSVSYIAKLFTPKGCIDVYSSAGTETKANKIDILQFDKTDTESKFYIYLKGKEKKVRLENYHSACNEILNLIEK